MEGEVFVAPENAAPRAGSAENPSRTTTGIRRPQTIACRENAPFKTQTVLKRLPGKQSFFYPIFSKALT